MKIETSKLKENLKILSGALGKTDYENKFYFRENKIYAISGALFISVDFDNDQEFTVDGKSFTAFINKVKAKEIEIEIGENVTIKTKKSRSQFPLYKEEQAIPTEIFDTPLTQAPVNFAEAIETVGYACSKNKATPHLGGVMLRGGEATATDGRQISVSDLGGEIDGEHIIPKSVVKYTKDLGIKEYAFEGDWFVFSTLEGVEIACSTLSGEYPSKAQIDGILDVSPDSSIIFPVNETIDALEICSVFLSTVDDLNKLVGFEIKGGVAKMTAKSLSGKHQAKVAVEFDGEVTFGINPSYFANILKKTDSVGVKDGRMLFESEDNRCIIALAEL